ncbi:Cell differentiation protein RCD1 [Fasciolopsis buskii]|uniref:CCR4-NOT transcription complex subunit 9 n=1 Tax=Fasciolopsis buskii TaxID=27845 RepID=A0A8E0RUS6_9TREM|nr:Cell differentiation protein RCD1 [Fasciolopsis buski]
MNNVAIAMTSSSVPSVQNPAIDMEDVYRWVSALTNVDTRESALLELCKIREHVPDLAPLLWHSCGSIAALLQEICAIYPYINPPRLNAHQSNRVCNALALLQCIASHPETRSDFLKANIPLYLYTFLNTNNPTRPFEYLRLTSLGVIGALVKTDEPEVIAFLLGSEIIPLCLVIMEFGSELSKTVATFIMQKILLDEVGLAYICQTHERFAHVAAVLGKVVIYLARDWSLRLMKHVIRCYLRLCDDPRARNALGQCLPQQLTDRTFSVQLENDLVTSRWLAQLLRRVSVAGPNANPTSTTSTITATNTTTSSGVNTNADATSGARNNVVFPTSVSTASLSATSTTTIANTVGPSSGMNTSNPGDTSASEKNTSESSASQSDTIQPSVSGETTGTAAAQS